MVRCWYGYPLWLSVFFCEFVNGLGEKYPEIFDGDGVESKHQINFAKKWGTYSTIYELAKGDITKYDGVVKEELEKCLLYLSYISDKIKLEEMMHTEAMAKMGR